MSAILTFLALADLALCPAVASLDAPRFRTREAITKGLRQCGPVALPALLRGERSTIPEVQRRCSALLAETAGARAWAAAGTCYPRGWKHLPWLRLDGDYKSEQVRDYLGRAHAQQEYPYGVWQSEQSSAGWPTGWRDYRYATRLWVYGQLQQGQTTGGVRFELEVMAQEEAAWVFRHGGLWTLRPCR